MKKYITATFLNTECNANFEQDFTTYSEFNNFLCLNSRRFTLLRVEYAN